MHLSEIESIVGFQSREEATAKIDGPLLFSAETPSMFMAMALPRSCYSGHLPKSVAL